MRVTYIHHSGFLVETDRFYYLFDYEKGVLPEMDVEKPFFKAFFLQKCKIFPHSTFLSTFPVFQILQ